MASGKTFIVVPSEKPALDEYEKVPFKPLYSAFGCTSHSQSSWPAISSQAWHQFALLPSLFFSFLGRVSRSSV